MTKATSAQVIQINITVINHADSILAFMGCGRRQLCSIHPQNLIVQQQQQQVSTDDLPTNYLTNTAQNCQGHKKQRKSKKLAQSSGSTALTNVPN